MRILVLGATGYIGSRLVPRLLADGHHVVATGSSNPDPDRFLWGNRVTWQRCDITKADQVRAAVARVDAICFLVHTLDRPGYQERDRTGAVNVREAANREGVGRIVYLSGLVPEKPRDELSAHITSRLEVEEELDLAEGTTLSLRAGVVIGAGSTSFEVVRHLASLLVVQPIPLWLLSRVQPVAVSDVVDALATELISERTGAVDLGGPDVVRYPTLLRLIGEELGLWRWRVPLVFAPLSVVAPTSALLSTAPFWTVAALVESLRHDMVCRPGRQWSPTNRGSMLTLREAIKLAVNAQAGTVPEAPLASDPAWTRSRDGAPVSVRSGLRLLSHRFAPLIRAARR
ncbi:MAG: NAD(P)H-binding protein [Nocardioides sp.]|nr:NAD(P)H-binding protein [Nocardioides sp.]